MKLFSIHDECAFFLLTLSNQGSKKSAFPPLPMVPRRPGSILQNTIIETVVFSFYVCLNVLPFVNSTGTSQPVTPSRHFLGAYPDSPRGFATWYSLCKPAGLMGSQTQPSICARTDSPINTTLLFPIVEERNYVQDK